MCGDLCMCVCVCVCVCCAVLCAVCCVCLCGYALCVLCAVCCVLCAVCCVLCAVCCVCLSAVRACAVCLSGVRGCVSAFVCQCVLEHNVACCVLCVAYCVVCGVGARTSLSASCNRITYEAMNASITCMGRQRASEREREKVCVVWSWIHTHSSSQQTSPNTTQMLYFLDTHLPQTHRAHNTPCKKQMYTHWVRTHGTIPQITKITGSTRTRYPHPPPTTHHPSRQT